MTALRTSEGAQIKRMRRNAEAANATLLDALAFCHATMDRQRTNTALVRFGQHMAARLQEAINHGGNVSVIAEQGDWDAEEDRA